MKLVHIKKDGSMDDISVKLVRNKLITLLTDISISKGENEIKELYTWTYGDYFIYCYGWYYGDAGFENKHELMPSGNSKFLEEDSSEKLLFGDIFLLCKKNKGEFMDFCTTDYAEMNEYFNDGFDECESSDENENYIEDYSSDHEIIIASDDDDNADDDGCESDNDYNEEGEYNNNDGILEEDNNNYMDE